MTKSRIVALNVLAPIIAAMITASVMLFVASSGSSGLQRAVLIFFGVWVLLVALVTVLSMRVLGTWLSKVRTRLSGTQSPTGGMSPPAACRSFELRIPSIEQMPRSTISISVDPKLYVPELLEVNGFRDYEPLTLATWLAIVTSSASGVAIDVGANVGPFSWLAAALSKRAVISFEPMPELMGALQAVAKANNLDIICEESAISDYVGEGRLHLSDKTDASNSLVPGFRPSSRSISVPVTTLDHYIASSKLVPLAIKIDTETNEPQVIRGARRIIQEHRPWIISEVLANRTEEQLMQEFSDLDYRWFEIGGSIPFEPRSEIVGDSSYSAMNWLFAPVAPSQAFWGSVEKWQRALRGATAEKSSP